MPNTIAELNDWSNQGLVYEDDRPYAITWSANATSNQSVSIVEDQSFILPSGIDLVSATSLPGNITYTVNAANVGNVILNWPTLPEGVTSSEPSPGIYQITGTFDGVTWAEVKAATVVFKDRTANATFTSNIAYPNTANVALSNVWSWTTNVAVTASSDEISTPSGFTFDEDTAKVITGYPQITDAYSGNLPFTITVTPNTTSAVLTMVSTGSANSSFDLPTRRLTITGTKTAVNTNLANITLTPGVDWDQNFSLTYSLTNPVSNLVTQVTQAANIGNVDTDFSYTSSYNYAEDGQVQLVFSVDDSDSTITELKMAVTQTVGTSGTIFVNGVNAGVGNTAVFTANSVANFNAGNVTFVPYADDTGNVSLTANVYKTNNVGNVTVATGQVMTLTCNSTHSDYSLTNSYVYDEDQGQQLVYSITDTDTRATSYTITVSDATANAGIFYINGVSSGPGNAGTITGSKSTVNAANIFYLPYPDYTGNISLQYNQYKQNSLFGNVTQASNVAVSMTVGNTHSDYSLTTSYNYSEDQTVPLVFEITDTDPNASSYTVRFSDATANAGIFYINGVSSGLGNAAVITDSKANINAANISYLPYPDYTGSVSLSYNQWKVNSLFGANVQQATNVAVSMTCTSTQSEYEFIQDSVYGRNRFESYQITDTDPNATLYTISIQQTAGNIGNWYVNGNLVSTANTVYSISNTRSAINSANINWIPELNDIGNATFVINQSKTNSVFGNIVQASNVVLNVSGNADPFVSNMITRSYTANTVNQIFATSTPSIDEGDVGQTYTIELSSTLGRFGNTGADALNNSSYSATGNLSTINNLFGNIVFVPNYGSTGANGTFTYSQSRDSALQVTSNVALNGTAASYAGNVYVIDANNATWTANPADLAFGNISVMLVGGGGAGSPAYAQLLVPPTVLRDGAGGGGGNVSYVQPFNRTTVANITTPWNITIGAGGTGFSNADPSLIYASSGNATSVVTGFATYTAGGGEGGATPKNSTLPSFGGGPTSYREFDSAGTQLSSVEYQPGTRTYPDGAAGAGAGGDGSGSIPGDGLLSDIAGGSAVRYGAGGPGTDNGVNAISSPYGLGGGGAGSLIGRTDGGSGVVVIKFA